MKKLSKEKRNQLIMVILGTVVLLALIYIGLIAPQDQELRTIANEKSAADAKLNQMKMTIKQSENSAAKVREASDQLLQAEGDLASGDIYAWTYDLISQFKRAYDVDIPAIGQPAIGAVDVLPHFPYSQQVTVSVNGTAYYHDFGKFIADFENKFPHIRVANLILEPADPDNEKLNFRMDIIALVKPNS
ncbi:MAG TPA: type II secretion system protein GspM [Candidatus Saccharimonadales bacterium]|nr:type II secretion system protein GspM [Candidatus Saccharimonadales bacterium]